MEVTSSSQASSQATFNPQTQHQATDAGSTTGGDDESGELVDDGDFSLQHGHQAAVSSSSLPNPHHLSLDLGGHLNSPTPGLVSTSSIDGDSLNNAVDVGGSGMELVHYGPALPPFYSTESFNYSKDVKDSKAVHGSCGLYNLGNTCFMNSGLQSLMSCAPLVKFFCEQYTMTDSSRHTLTAHFYLLLCKLWSGQYSVVHPRKFKDFLGFYHSQFEDYRQHDCQEFLALLLDTLHEQLNRAAALGVAQPQLQLCQLGSASPPADEDVPHQETCSDKVRLLNNEEFDINQAALGEGSQTGAKKSAEFYVGEGSTSSKLSNLGRLCFKVREGSSEQMLGSPTSDGSAAQSEVSIMESVLTSPASSSKSPDRLPISSGGRSDTVQDDEEDAISSSSYPQLHRYASRPNVDDVTSSDSNFISTSVSAMVKPSLKRVSSGSSVSTTSCGGSGHQMVTMHSEDSNHSSLSAHSTDSEQSSSSAFKRLKIDAVSAGSATVSEMSRAVCTNNNNSSLKDCVTSSTDCKKLASFHRRNQFSMCIGSSPDSGDILGHGSGDIDPEASVTPLRHQHENIALIDSMVTSCQDPAQHEAVPKTRPGEIRDASIDQPDQQLVRGPSRSEACGSSSQPGLPSLEDFYSKETKTLNTNVLVSDFLQEVTADSEKFAKVDNRSRPPSKEVNILHDAFLGEEDKTDKVLIAQSLGAGAGVKDVNLHVVSSGGAAVMKPCMGGDINVLNNALTTGASGAILTWVGEDEKTGPVKLVPDCNSADANSDLSKEGQVLKTDVLEGSENVAFKFVEEEKNVQMQAYSKFNTTPTRSNIRADLTDSVVADPCSMEVDEPELMESSEDDEDPVVPIPLRESTVEACSAVPNCLRDHCPVSDLRMANQAWQDYQVRNDSVIVSTFQGQFRSTVVCSECSHVSVTYEPFMYLSLPIPHAMDQQICVTYVCQDRAPVKYLLNLLKTDKVDAAKRQLNELLGQPHDMDLIMAEVLDSHISRILDNNVLLKYINTFNRKIYAFEVILPPVDAMDIPPSTSPLPDQSISLSMLNNTNQPKSRDVCYSQEASNQSFESVVVNSPSSRDTLDCVFSDPEPCDQSSVQATQFSAFFSDEAEPLSSSSTPITSSAINHQRDTDDGQCHLTSSTDPLHGSSSLGRHPWLMNECSNDQRLMWPSRGKAGSDNDDYDADDKTINNEVFGDNDTEGLLCKRNPVVDEDSRSMNITSSSPDAEASTPRDNVSSFFPASDLTSGSSLWTSRDDLQGGDSVQAEAAGSIDNEAEPGLCEVYHTTSSSRCRLDSSSGAGVISTTGEESEDCFGERSVSFNREESGDIGATHGSPEASSSSSSQLYSVSLPTSTAAAAFCDSHLKAASSSPVSSSTYTCDTKRQQLHNCRQEVKQSQHVGQLVSSSSSSRAGNTSLDTVGEKRSHTISASVHSSSEWDKHTDMGSIKGSPRSSKHSEAGSVKGSPHSSGGQMSRSCPSPQGFVGGQDSGEAGLLGAAAAKLSEAPGLYFLHHQDDPLKDGDDLAGERRLSPTQEPLPIKESEASSWWQSQASTSEIQHSAYASDQWRSCAICLEDLLDTELLTHVSCDGAFCHNCLEMSVKHTADVSAFSCPICLQPANMCEDFVPLASASSSKPKIRTLPICLAFRHGLPDNSGSLMLQLFGHPNIIHVPSVTTGTALYNLLGSCVNPALGPYTILFTDGQGLRCSRCPYPAHCQGCVVSCDAVELRLQPWDCLTIHLTEELPPDQVGELQAWHEDASMAGLRSSEPTTIMDCFGAFTQSELLDEHNPWYCPHCERNQCAKKTMTVWRYPDNLIIHLKRFVYQDLSSTKVDARVIFPHEAMDVRGFLSGPPGDSSLLYDLHSVVCHMGGASAGHYTCLAKHPLTGQWYLYNDETVSPQEPGDAEFTSGYVLFYQRQGTEVEFRPPQNLPYAEEEDNHPHHNHHHYQLLQQHQHDTITEATSAVPSSSGTITIKLPSDLAVDPISMPSSSSSSSIPIIPRAAVGGSGDNHGDDDDDYDAEEGLVQGCEDNDDSSLTVHFGTTTF